MINEAINENINKEIDEKTIKESDPITYHNIEKHPLVLKEKEERLNKLGSAYRNKEDLKNPEIYSLEYFKSNFYNRIQTSYEFKDSDKIFILSTAKLVEKKKFNKLIKDKIIKGKGTYKIEEATVIVTDKNKSLFDIQDLCMVVYRDSTEPKGFHIITPRDLKYTIMQYCFPEDFIVSFNSPNPIMNPKKEQIYSWHANAFFDKLSPEDKKFYKNKSVLAELLYIKTNYVDVNPAWYERLINSEVTIIDETVVLGKTFTILNERKEDSAEYNMEAIHALLESDAEENHKIAFTILEQIDLTNEYFTLAGLFLTINSWRKQQIKTLFFEKLIKRNPLLKSVIPNQYSTINSNRLNDIVNMAEGISKNFNTKISARDIEAFIHLKSEWKDIIERDFNVKELNFMVKLLNFLGHEIDREKLIEIIYTKDGNVGESDFQKYLKNETLSQIKKT